MKKTSVISTVLALALMAAPMLTSCSDNSDPNSTPEPTPTPTISPELAALLENTIDAVITLENGDTINLELYPDLAPKTVENFVELANDGTYDGTIFHRVVEGFVIQAGGYDEDLNEIKASPIMGEFTSNGFTNELPHTRGTISMARTTDPDSASSQFFIVQEDSNYLDGEYAAFGRVKDEESLTVIDDIASVRTGTNSSMGLEDVPVSAVVISSIKIGSGAASNAKPSKTEKPSDDTVKDLNELRTEDSVSS